MAIGKFESTESLMLEFEPFIDKTTGDYVETGDTVTVAVTKPDASTASLPATRDSNTKNWFLTITTGSYIQGRWFFRATSDNGNTRAQYAIAYWGLGAAEGVATLASGVAAIKAKTDNLPAAPASTGDVTSAATAIEAAVEGVGAHTILEVYNRLGAPAGASISADIANVASVASTIQGAGSHTIADVFARLGAPAGASVSADIAALDTKIGTPASSVSADIANVGAAANAAATAATGASAAASAASSAAASVLTIATFLQKVAANRWKIVGTQLIYYDNDGVTPIATFNLKDSSGAPSSTQIFERLPV